MIMKYLLMAARGSHKNSHNAVTLLSARSWSGFSHLICCLWNFLYICV